MGTNSKISIHRNSEDVRLKLSGDLDGASAHELLNVLKRGGLIGALIPNASINSLKKNICQWFR